MLNPYFKWYQRATWFGISANLWFALNARHAPQGLQKRMKLDPIPSTVWLRNVGMLLENVSMLNAAAAIDPRRSPVAAWCVPVTRVNAGLFFLIVVARNPASSSERPGAFLPLGVFDTTMGLVCGTLLYLGFRHERQSAAPTTAGSTPAMAT